MAEAGSAPAMVPERAKLHIAMMTFQFGYAVNHVVMRAALNMGVSKLVFPLYRNIVALIALAPFAYFLEKKDRPAITCSFLVQFFLLGLLGIEQVHLTRKDGIAKVLGTFVSVAGASVITLYKGPIIYSPNPPSQQSHLSTLGDAEGKSWTLGCICLIGHCLFWSSWIVLQSPLLKKYPARLSVVSYSCCFSVMQFSAIAAYFERDSRAWQVHSSWELLTILYSGLVASAMAFAIQIWVIDRGGPVFVSAYLPVQTMLVAVMATVALGEEFYLGGIIGALLIISGLYLVVLGKNEESKYSAAISSVSDENKCVKGPGKASLVRPLLPTIGEC
ncbi:hypothetical protein EZV62_014313 [Acer yangbiense]|uniref:WAT1-related protein n=1 Tax=Acer yangbiense TaxID=1000413 RepID=A0A5C7HRY0_9ROSI|nr:hypothetical protein EZV62_014313 [Acer yangbiense]